MGAPRFLHGLALILLLQVLPSQPAEASMMPKPGTRMIREAPQRLRETQLSEEALWHSHGLPVSHVGLPPRSFAGPGRSRAKRHTRDRPGEQECHLQSLLVRVKDLGLGYDSEETILFKFCSGSCPKVRSNHDLTLSLLLQKSEIPAPSEPCCRPSQYEDVAFLDNSHRWHEVEQLSASVCSCVG